MALPYYKRYPRDLIEGTIGMSLELKGAYGLVLDLIYMQGGALPDDSRYISGLLGCTVRKWKSIRKELLKLNKIYMNGELLSNYRADNELETLRKFQFNQAEKGRRSNKNKDLRETTVKPARDYPEPEPDKKEHMSLSEKRDAPKRLKYSDEFEDFWQEALTTPNMSKKAAWGQWKRLDHESRLIARKALPAFKDYMKTADHSPQHVERYLSKRTFDGYACASRSLTFEEQQEQLAALREAKQARG